MPDWTQLRLPVMAVARLDPDALPRPVGPHRPRLPSRITPCKTIWSGEHSTDQIIHMREVAELLDRLTRKFHEALAPVDWQARLTKRIFA